MTSKYYNPIADRYNENRLIEDIQVECITLFGTSAFYIPRNSEQTDLVYGEDPLKSFTSYFPIDIYNSDTEDFEGQKEVFSKFGIQMKLEYTILLSRKTFMERVAQFGDNIVRPNEGDLIYIPHVRKGMLYEITFVNPEDDFFILNRYNPYYWRIKLEPFKYSQEMIQVGHPDIDSIPGEDAYTQSFLVSSGSGNYLVLEQVYQGLDPENPIASGWVSYWDHPTLTLNVTNIMGVFSTNTSIIGSDSGASYTLVSYDPLQQNLIREVFDNPIINTEGSGYLNTTESNPLTSNF